VRGVTTSAGRVGPPDGAASAPVQEDSGADLLVWLLGAVAVLCVLGLVPLYALVLRTYDSLKFLAAGIDFLVATSFSKSFSLYGERVGALSVLVAFGIRVAF
jgi:hypothetical protein